MLYFKSNSKLIVFFSVICFNAISLSLEFFTISSSWFILTILKFLFSPFSAPKLIYASFKYPSFSTDIYDFSFTISFMSEVWLYWVSSPFQIPILNLTFLTLVSSPWTSRVLEVALLTTHCPKTAQFPKVSAITNMLTIKFLKTLLSLLPLIIPPNKYTYIYFILLLRQRLSMDKPSTQNFFTTNPLTEATKEAFGVGDILNFCYKRYDVVFDIIISPNQVFIFLGNNMLVFWFFMPCLFSKNKETYNCMSLYFYYGNYYQ